MLISELGRLLLVGKRLRLGAIFGCLNVIVVEMLAISLYGLSLFTVALRSNGFVGEA